jgi:ABC-type arginine transport system permease subunit
MKELHALRQLMEQGFFIGLGNDEYAYFLLKDESVIAVKSLSDLIDLAEELTERTPPTFTQVAIAA